MSEEAAGLPPETHIMFAGELPWRGGYVIRCGECGATTGWRLTAEPEADPDHGLADDAYMTCQNGHRQRHPLIYPTMVRALWEACRDGVPTGQEVTSALQAIDWRPHNRVPWHDGARYFSWEYKPGPDETTWPDLTWAWQGGTLPRPPAVPKPPARRSFIFVDFGGVLSDDEYWLSLRGPGHRLKARLDAGMERIWHTSPAISRSWMKGELSFGEVLAAMGLEPEDPGFLERTLQEDARRMRVDPGIAKLLLTWFSPGDTELILATDNTPQFAKAFWDACSKGKRGTEPPLTMADAAPWFSWHAVSADVGCLKADAPGLFFGAALNTFSRWQWEDTLLIDDRADNCDAFTQMGGTAIRWHLRDDARELEKQVGAWLARRAG